MNSGTRFWMLIGFAAVASVSVLLLNELTLGRDGYVAAGRVRLFDGVMLALAMTALSVARPGGQQLQRLWGRWRTMAVNGAVVVVSILVVLVVLEGVLRMDPVTRALGLGHRPALTAWYNETSLNSLDFHDEEHAMEKPPGTFRILVLGDSFTFGRLLELEELWWRRLQQLLNKRGYSRKIEVISLARDGWSTGSQLNALRSVGFDFDPDHILVGFVHNDIQFHINRLPDVAIFDFLDPHNRHPWPYIFRVSNLLDRIVDRSMMMSGLYPTSDEWNAYLYDFNGKQWQQWLATVDTLASEAGGRNIPISCAILADVAVPLARNPNAVLVEQAADVLRRHDVEVYNLYPILGPHLSTLSMEETWLWPREDPHPNAYVHGLYAKALDSLLHESEMFAPLESERDSKSPSPAY